MDMIYIPRAHYHSLLPKYVYDFRPLEYTGDRGRLLPAALYHAGVKQSRKVQRSSGTGVSWLAKFQFREAKLE